MFEDDSLFRHSLAHSATPFPHKADAYSLEYLQGGKKVAVRHPKPMGAVSKHCGQLGTGLLCSGAGLAVPSCSPGARVCSGHSTAPSGQGSSGLTTLQMFGIPR